MSEKAMKVRVRMYRVGLGDCFLLSFFEESRPGEFVVHMLIDCGVDVSTKGGAEALRKAVDDIATETGKNLDLLVATHEHWDHVSGFVHAKEAFEELTIKHVWLAWTEDPTDVFARELKSEASLAMQGIAAAAAHLAKNAALNPKEHTTLKDVAKGAMGVLSFFGVEKFGAGKFSRRTDEAMDYVSSKKKDSTYCVPGGEALTLPGLEGVRFYVLGPPKDEKALRRMDPSSSNPETYGAGLRANGRPSFLAAAASLNGKGGIDGLGDYPFPASRQLSQEEAGAREFFQQTYFSEDEAWRRIEYDWLAASAEFALQLDNAVNNTSLVLAIELVESGSVLLFAGDAQVGSWLSWGAHTWTIPGAADGSSEAITLKDLFQRTVLYKVGHHGSHNGTLSARGLELMTSPNLMAIIPVDQAFAEEKKHWAMPFEPLYDRLVDKCKGRVLRVDKCWPTKEDEKPKGLSEKEWSAFKTVAVPEEDYIDVVVS